VLSTNVNSFHTKFYNKGTRHHENERQSQHKPSVISAAPVHKKFVPKSSHCDSSNHFISRFINGNINSAPSSGGIHNNHSNNNHYSLSLNRHTPNHNNFGVGCNGTLTSPYAFSFAGNGGADATRSAKSDVGVPISSRRAMRSLPKGNLHNVHGRQLPSVHSDLSLDVHKDILNNNHNNHSNGTTAATATATPSAIMSLSSLSKTGSKLLYSNRHRLDSCKYANNNNGISHHGPLVYKNDDELMRCDWSGSVFDNPIMSVS
jgi:hypothetical protein